MLQNSLQSVSPFTLPFDAAAGPRFDDENLTLAEAYRKFHDRPGVDPNLKVPLIIRMLENPKSPVRLSGAVSLYHHDLIHCLLARGPDSDDEAFTIGMTMGSVPNLRDFEIRLYKIAGRFLFPGIYKFSSQDLFIYESAVRLARSMPDLRPLDSFNAEELLPKPLGVVRAELGIDARRLYHANILYKAILRNG